MTPRTNRNPLVIAARLLAAEAVNALIPAPAAGFRLRIFSVAYSVRVAAAQIVDLGVAAGTAAQQIGAIPASFAGVGQILSEAGFALPAATAFSADPVAAGPEIQFLIEYVIEEAPKTA